MNGTEWMVMTMALTALAAMVMDQFVIPEWHDSKSVFRSFDTYIDDLVAGNGARKRRDDGHMLD